MNFEKTEFQKIGVNTLKVFQSNGRWLFKHSEKIYDMAPAGITDFVLSPLIVGADRLIALVCKKKNIKDEFLLLFSEEYFPNADVKLNFSEVKYEGWIYSIEELNMKGFIPGQSIWICPYMKFFYESQPNVLYLKVESNETI